MMAYSPTSGRDTDSPFARVFYPKLDELLAEGMDYDSAHWHARQYAREVQEREISDYEAARNAALVGALGITYGAAPSPADSTKSTETRAEADVLDWDSIIAEVNANRR